MLNLSQPEVGAMLSTGIVGGGLPIAVGLALSAQLDNTDRVTAVTFGDGATNTGSFHEAMNLAALWNVPWSSSARTTSTERRPRFVDQ